MWSLCCIPYKWEDPNLAAVQHKGESKYFIRSVTPYSSIAEQTDSINKFRILPGNTEVKCVLSSLLAICNYLKLGICSH